MCFFLQFMLIVLVRYAFCVISTEDFWADEKQDLQTCICVPYWQCKDDYSGIVDNGVEAMDIRLSPRSANEGTRNCMGDFDVCCEIQCGQRRMAPADNEDDVGTSRLTPRIMGNDEAEFGEFPWMLGILRQDKYKCGASLIHPQVAITAAHCVFNTGPYKVRAGEWNWLSTEERLPFQERMTKKIIIHPYFQLDELRNDIALLILESPFQIAENVGIVCLPPSDVNYSGSKCTASGWGKNTSLKGTFQTTLKKITMPIVSRSACLTSLRNAVSRPFLTLHRSFICAGGGGDRDTCKGDGGSPLVCAVQPNVYEQVGIVSWGLKCGQYNTPGLYVNVAMFNGWIDQTMMMNNFDIHIYRY